MEGIDTFFNCLIAALGLSLISAWPGLYILWGRELRGRPVFSGWLQVLRWLTWLVLFSLVAFGTIYVLGYIFAVLRIEAR